MATFRELSNPSWLGALRMLISLCTHELVMSYIRALLLLFALLLPLILFIFNLSFLPVHPIEQKQQTFAVALHHLARRSV